MSVIARRRTSAITTAVRNSRTTPGGGRIMLLTRKNANVAAAGPRLGRLPGGPVAGRDRRPFLERVGVVAGAGAFASQLPYGGIGKVEAAADSAAKVEVKRTICRHCVVGGGIGATVA